jgi:hypothetical protein
MAAAAMTGVSRMRAGTLVGVGAGVRVGVLNASVAVALAFQRLVWQDGVRHREKASQA